MKSHFRFVYAICTFIMMTVSLSYAAYERIVSFDSHIQVLDDGTIKVTEEISVDCQQEKIRHGIYRDFPTRYQDRNGLNFKVGFDVVAVLRDGLVEDFRTETQSNGVRTYIGKKETLLPTGIHTFTITYKTNRQLGFFADHDEFYWNVTGNGWAFPIERATCRVSFPQRVPRNRITMAAFTGVQGSIDNFTDMSMTQQGEFLFKTTRFMDTHEGLTILLSWPKGFFAAPTKVENFSYFLWDNFGIIIGLLGLLILLSYYYKVWKKVGRDPAKKAIIPLYTPPSEYSPAAMRCIINSGYDDCCISSAILNLAVKKYLNIEKHKRSYSLIKVEKGDAPLSPEETMLLEKLFDGRERVDLDTTRITSAVKPVQKQLEEKYSGAYLRKNTRFWFYGLCISLGTLVASICMTTPQDKLPPSIFLIVWCCITGPLWVWALSKIEFTVGWIISALFMSLFFVPEFGLLCYLSSWPIGVLIALFAGCIIVFHHLLRAPTELGQRAMEQIKGFTMFLSATEKDFLNYVNEQEQTPELFERYLPYALALGVENRWAEKFSAIIAAAATTTAYTPHWYSDTRGFSAAHFTSSFSSSFSSAVSSSSSPPGSSSGGGGGGSSGGGGGGGGGGGW
jgi:uncharacterized membrane protein YgcG